MKKILILIATIAMFTSCEKYNYKAVYSVKDENDNLLFVDTVYREGSDNAKLYLWRVTHYTINQIQDILRKQYNKKHKI